MSGVAFVAPIVEGHGEVQAVPILLRRIAAEYAPALELKINPPLRIKSGSFLRDEDYFQKHVELAARKVKPWSKSCVWILLDCEDDCPAVVGPAILQRAISCRPDTAILVTLAYREYETWFLAAAHSLQGVCNLPADIEPPADPESSRDAKAWLAARMGVPYNEPNHQPRLTAAFSFAEASSIPSFARTLEKLSDFFTKEIER